MLRTLQTNLINKLPLATKLSTPATVSSRLLQVDPLLYDLIDQEQQRQKKCVTLIASENYTPRYCSEALASCLAGKYSEGYPGKRYYAGNENIDKIESLCQQRALKAFRLDPNIWAVNVQAHSGSGANFAVYNGLINPNDPILHLKLSDGGHLSHGHRVKQKAITTTARYFDPHPYVLNKDTELIDYEQIFQLADKIKPKIIIAGYSAFPRLLDYRRFKEISSTVGALLMSDIAHISGPMAAGVIPSAFDYSDIVTTTTHKSLRGPRGALIFSRRPLDQKIDASVFPSCQGGPHNHSIAAIAVALKVAADPEFKRYQSNILANAQALASVLTQHGFRLVTGGTENHMVLVDLTNKGIDGNKAEKVLESVNIITNKNSVLKDKSVKIPHGLRLGSPAMTSRGFMPKDFRIITEHIIRALNIGSKFQKDSSEEKFKTQCKESRELKKIRREVIKFVSKFPFIQSSIWPIKM